MDSASKEHVEESSVFGDYPVIQIDHYMIEMPDGIQLAAKFWFPSGDLNGSCFENVKHQVLYRPKYSPKQVSDKDKRFPVIMEYIPYRKAEWSAERDHRRYPWFASHGYVCLRLDMRGTGDSDGLCFDEYLKQEQDDCIDAMNWISQQKWSNQNIGMIGKSWSGFNGLQLAYCQPTQLKAVVSLYSTDDRYVTDMHHDGGCITGDGLLSWASQLFVWHSRNPDPRNVKDWKALWMERLEKSGECWAKHWLSHQMKDEYWLQGSIANDYSRVKCPILAIGGWRDGYRDAVLRMVQHLPNVKGIIGPWNHDWPDVCKPAPHMEYLEVSLQWFDYHLKGIENDVMSEPKLRMYLQSPVTPKPCYDHREGKWVALKGWPSEDIDKHTFYVDTKSCTMAKEKLASTSWIKIPCMMETSIYQGLWLDLGGPYGHSNQCFADGHSLRFISEALERDIPLVGHVSLDCDVRVLNHNQGILAVRLVDLSPLGKSTLITHGMLNLTHYKGHSTELVRDIVPGELLQVTLEFHSTTYIIPKGHKLMLCLSSALWPGAWPSSKVTDIEVSCPVLNIPFIRDILLYTNPMFDTKNPTVGPPLSTQTLDKSPDYGVKVECDVSTGKYKRTVTLGRPRTVIDSIGVIIGNKTEECYEIVTDEPLSARVSIVQEYVLEYPDFEGGIVTKVLTKSSMYADERFFYLENKLTTWINDTIFFEKEWKNEIERNFV